LTITREFSPALWSISESYKSYKSRAALEIEITQMCRSQVLSPLKLF
jgi:hypothetical protein